MLTTGKAEQLVNQLNLNIGVFAWELSDMLGISPEVMSHKLRIHSRSKPIRKKVGRLSSER